MFLITMEWQNTTCSNSKQTFSLKKKVNLRKEEAVETIVTIAREMLNFQRPTDPIAIKLSRKWTYKLRNFLDAAINLHSEQPLFKRAYFLPRVRSSFPLETVVDQPRVEKPRMAFPASPPLFIDS